MDKDDFLGDRRRALEDAFFQKVQQENLAALRAKLDLKTSRDELSAATGIKDLDILDKLISLGVKAQALTALTLVPLLRVAWADGKLQPSERAAILKTAQERGISDGSPGHALLSSWLEEAPPPALHEAWAAYTQTLCAKLSPEQRAAVRDQVLGFAHAVAEAAGGFLGVRKISPAEEQVLRALAKAFV